MIPTAAICLMFLAVVVACRVVDAAGLPYLAVTLFLAGLVLMVVTADKLRTALVRRYGKTKWTDTNFYEDQ